MLQDSLVRRACGTATRLLTLQLSGRNIASHLLRTNRYVVKLGSRNALRSPLANVFSAGGNLGTVEVDVSKPDTLARAFEHADVVISLAGRLQASQHEFEELQWRGAGNVARAAREAGASLVHFSAIGADAQSSVPYWRTKALGETEVLREHPEATVIRPSLIFGPGNEFGPGDEFFGVCQRCIRSC